VTQMMQEAFGEQMDSTFAALGNHDVFRPNQYNFEEGSSTVEATKTLWKNWLDQEAFEEYEKFGYYSQYMRLSSG